MKKRESAAAVKNAAYARTLSVAKTVTLDIQTADRLSLVARTPRGRLAARKVKHLKVSNAVARFGQFLEVLSVHDHPRFGASLVLRFCGAEFVASLDALTEEARGLLAPAVARQRRRDVSMARAA